MKKLLTLALILSATLFVQAQKYELALNLEVGKVYIQKSNAKMTITQNFNGMPIEIGMNVKGDYTFKVMSADNNQYNMEVNYTTVEMEMESAQGKSSFSSNNPNEQDIMSTMLSRMINKPFTMIMSQSGKVVEINGIDNLFGSLFEGYDLTEQQKEQILAQLKQSYGAKAIKGSFEQITAIYPEEKVKLGKKWSTETNIEAGMSVNLTTNFELKAANSEYFLIHGEGDLVSNSNAPYVKQNGMDIKILVDGHLTSDIKIDRKTGWIIDATIVQNLSGNTELKASEQMPDGMSIPMTIKSKSVITN
ncbi:hypothetical protein DF185_13265 [Marinifilum breve]|uniref:DUF4412 domain-containing protein n=1 Tax=Marinifilum breve TaxID=2184082 RepID=A0A2V3ZWK8_9BACT|nr:DUF6263 family protein [Marinifilum breve]PXY00862.1 hypothetical protein DF185_13265 [Marinifilum breve]